MQLVQVLEVPLLPLSDTLAQSFVDLGVYPFSAVQILDKELELGLLYCAFDHQWLQQASHVHSVIQSAVFEAADVFPMLPTQLPECLAHFFDSLIVFDGTDDERKAAQNKAYSFDTGHRR